MSELSDQAMKARRVKASEVQLGQEIILPEFVGVITESHEEDYDAREDRPGHWCLVLEGGEAAEVDRDATVFVLEGVPGDERQRAEHATRCNVAAVTARAVGGEVRRQDSLRVQVLRNVLTEARTVLETALDAEVVELREFSEVLLSIRVALDV